MRTSEAGVHLRVIEVPAVPMERGRDAASKLSDPAAQLRNCAP